MTRDPLWNDIRTALGRHVDHLIFERCAQDILRDAYPGLAPVVGGSDAGKDGSFGTGTGGFPLVCTTGDVVSNVRNSLNNFLREHGGPKRCVVATTEFLTPHGRRKIENAVEALGVTLVNIHDGEDFVGRLYANDKWRLELLGVTGAPSALSKWPPNPRRVSSSALIGRESDLAWLQSTADDLLLVGQPGSGKTHLHQHWAAEASVAFAVSEDPTALANAIRAQKPAVIVVDDAHVRLSLLALLRRLRRELGADYRIHANCWPSYEAKVSAALEVGTGQVRQLQRLSRKVMASLIESLGVGGPDVLISLLLNQSAGKPGLCAALVDACKRDGVQRVWTGEVLADQLLAAGQLIRDEIDREVLARVALGGKSGVDPAKIAARMGLSTAFLRSRVAELGAGGVFVEVDNRTLALSPSSLDGVLVRDVFYSGLFRPDIDAALADCVSFKESTHVLIGAAQRGAAVDREKIRSRVIGAASRDLWQHYAYLDEQAARDLIVNFPDHVCDAGEGLLEQVPELALPALIGADDRGLVQNEGDSRHPHQLIRSWLAPWEQEERTGARRAMLLAVLEELSANDQIGDDLLVKYIAECVHPRVHGHRTSPVERNTVVIRRGVHSDETLREIAALWPRILELLPASHSRSWLKFYDAVSEWAWPARGGDSVGEERSAYMHETARGLIQDLLQKLPDNRVHLHQIRWINTHATLGLDVPEPDAVARLFEERLRTEPWQVGFDQRDVELQALAAELIAMGTDAACSVLGEVERDFAIGLIHGGYDRFRLYWFIAEGVNDAVLWLEKLVEDRTPSQFVARFLNAIAARNPERLQPVLRQLLVDELYHEIAVQNVVHSPHTARDLVDDVIGGLKPLEKDNESRFAFNKVPVDVMVRLLTHAEPAVRAGAALGEWMYATDHAIRPELLKAWRLAVIAADPKHDGLYNDLFAAHADVARAWAARKITAATGYELWRYRHTISAVATTLDRDGRLALLLLMDSVERYDSHWFDALVANDIGLFERWLQGHEGESMRSLPLCRRPSSRWVERVIVALNVGVPEDDIVGRIGGWDEEWSGPEAEHFQQYLTQFEDLSRHSDVRIQRIAIHGVEWAKRRVAAARPRDEAEDFD